MIPLRMFRIAVYASVLVLAACAAAQPQHDGSVYPVEWFPGFTLGGVLHEPSELTNVADVRRAIATPWYAPYELSPAGDASGEVLSLVSCAEYLPLRDRALRPSDPTAWVPFMGMAKSCQAARLITLAQPSAHSYVRRLAFDADLPEMLPVAVGLAISPSRTEQIKAAGVGARWDDVFDVDVHKPCRERYGNQCGIYHDNAGGQQQVVLVARGDFDGDGIEDLLVESRDSVEGGSFAAVRMFLLTRRTPGGEIELIRELDY